MYFSLSMTTMATPLSTVRITLNWFLLSSLRVLDLCRVILGLEAYFVKEPGDVNP